MAKVRQDAWSHEDDLLLAETVLRHVREGSTQLNAFDEVGDKLNRTSAACGFRWNAEVRSKYDNAMDLAKRQRKEKKRAMITNSSQAQRPILTLPQDYKTMQSHLTSEAEIEPSEPSKIDGIIDFLREMKNDFNHSNQSKFTLDQAEKENQQLKEHVRDLEKQLNKTEEQLATIKEDYQVFIQIMDRARKMTVLDDQGSLKSPAFKMDKNGNLEQLAEGLNS